MEKKWYDISGLVAACILLNYLGKLLAHVCRLPLWLDSLGTAWCAYVLGPACGAVAGASVNLLYALRDPVSLAYGLTSVAIAVVVGRAARRGAFETLFGTMTAGMLLSFVSVVVSLPLSLIFYGGMTGNVWGDAVFGWLREQGFPTPVCSLVGQYYVDFADKMLTLICLFVLQRLRLWRREHAGAAVVAAGLLAAAPAGADAAPLAEGRPDFNAYIQTVYSSGNGLPCGEANDIAQTDDGILWVGTYAGLYRYNGSEFRWMNEFGSVRSVKRLYLDEEGRLWIGTNDSGLAVCIHGRITNVINEGSGLPSNSVQSITKSSDGYYYVGTSDAVQVLVLDSGLRMLNAIPEVIYAQSMDADGQGNVAAVTLGGELCLLRGGQFVTSLRLERGKEVFTCCAFGPDGMLYAGTSRSAVEVYAVSGGGFLAADALDSGALSYLKRLYFADDGRLFVCADNGIGYLEEGESHLINTADFNNSIDNMAVDYQGNYWFTSSRKGLLRLTPSPFTNLYAVAGLKSKVANTVAEWQGRLYVGTDRGLDVLDASGTRPVQDALAESLGTARIRCLLPDSQGTLWVCTYGRGLVAVAPDGSTVSYDSAGGVFADRVRLACEFSDGTVHASGDSGIICLRGREVVRRIPFGGRMGSAQVLTLMELPGGYTLVGTDGDGLLVIDGEGQVVRRLTTQDGLTSGVVMRTVAASRPGCAFIVTSNSLCYMDEDFHVRPLDNFPYYNNFDVYPDGTGQLFVSGSSGVLVVSEAEVLSGGNVQFIHLDARMGLDSALTANAWNYRDGADNLYLACDTGVYRVNMRSYGTARRTYRMMLDSVLLDGVPYKVERDVPVTIGRGTEKIELVPEVINYTALDPAVSYYLEGFDATPWTLPQSELTRITYTNVPPGEYTFHLAVLDGRGGEVLEQSQYAIVKERAMYDNRWFQVYMLVVAMAAVAWFTWFVARTQAQRSLAFQERELDFVREQVRMGNETIITIAKAVDAKDGNTSQHSMRVSDYSVMIARELGMGAAECENLRKAALLHDIGKIGIPDRILNKPGRLTDEEYVIMKSHVTRGAEILKDFTMIDHVREGALYHHERWDGKGYAQGLKGEEIPLYGRIIGVADAFDAMTANRVYRQKLDFDYVLGELRRGRGSQFDPRIVDIMLSLIESGKIDVAGLYRSAAGEGQ